MAATAFPGVNASADVATPPIPHLATGSAFSDHLSTPLPPSPPPQRAAVGTFTMVIGRVDTSDLAQGPTQTNTEQLREGFICPVCQIDFASDVALKEHFVTTHLLDSTPGAGGGGSGRGTPVPRSSTRDKVPQTEPKQRSKPRRKRQDDATPQPGPQRFCTTCGISLHHMQHDAVQEHYESHHAQEQSPMGTPVMPHHFMQCAVHVLLV